MKRLAVWLGLSLVCFTVLISPALVGVGFMLSMAGEQQIPVFGLLYGGLAIAFLFAVYFGWVASGDE